jgi:hypothetical protein
MAYISMANAPIFGFKKIPLQKNQQVIDCCFWKVFVILQIASLKIYRIRFKFVLPFY